MPDRRDPAVLSAPVGRVVVGVDDSAPSTRALRFAIDEAERTGSELEIIHAWIYPYRLTLAAQSLGADIAQVDAALVLDKALAMARDVNALPVIGRLVEEGATQALMDAGDAADLLVVGHRGAGGFRSMLLGSVAHGVAANAGCPVIVVR